MEFKEDEIEAAFWDFDHERKQTGAERDAFKAQMREVVMAHLTPYMRALNLAEDACRAAYTPHFDEAITKWRAGDSPTLQDAIRKARGGDAPPVIRHGYA